MILSRWIKDSRLNDELGDHSVQLSFGLRNSRGEPIQFARYDFMSNDARASIYQWLTAGGYTGTQYIGFFNLEDIRNWLNMDFVIDKLSGFQTSNFFICNPQQTFLTNNQHPVIQNLGTPPINSSVLTENGILKLFEPPGYPVYLENGNIIRYEANPGEVDIVATGMHVYGIYCTNKTDLILSTKRQYYNNLRENYSELNVNLINAVLDRMRQRGFANVHDNLLNLTQLNQHFTQQIQDIYFNTLNQIVNNLNNNHYQNNQQIRNLILRLNGYADGIVVQNGNNILLNEQLRHQVDIRAYSGLFGSLNRNFSIEQPDVLNITFEVNQYINENFMGSLLNIASFLNNPATRAATIDIFTEVRQQFGIVGGSSTNILNLQDKSNSKNKYLKYKAKYLELKNKIQNI